MELAVALLVSALVVLLAVGFYAQSAKTTLQAQSMAVMIDQHIYGVASLNEQLRLAGLGMTSQPQALLWDREQLHGLTGIDTKHLSSAGRHPSNLAIASDQLTVRYVAPADMLDCEGSVVLGPRRARLTNGQMALIDGQVVIERYFVNKEADGSLALRCDAARYVTDEIERDSTRDRRGLGSAYTSAIIDRAVADRGVRRANQVRGLGDQGELMLSEIEGFWVRWIGQQAQSVQVGRMDEVQSEMLIDGVQIAILAQELSDADAENSVTIFDQRLSLTEDKPRKLYQLQISFANAGTLSAADLSLPVE